MATEYDYAVDGEELDDDLEDGVKKKREGGDEEEEGEDDEDEEEDLLDNESELKESW